MYSDYGQHRHEELTFHLGQLEKLAIQRFELTKEFASRIVGKYVRITLRIHEHTKLTMKCHVNY